MADTGEWTSHGSAWLASSALLRRRNGLADVADRQCWAGLWLINGRLGGGGVLVWLTGGEGWLLALTEQSVNSQANRQVGLRLTRGKWDCWRDGLGWPAHWSRRGLSWA
ncbi:hypothetical protein TIFTF001_027605 [Ficus carica]|uniref:Uncharacterized protein n=1 Tax=Ficus carica TaxID=3494 RepID=A0AA88DNB3_FICCA|nr:hypothetical protein TIFTF001_027605 [Ficus carica]